jgi:hypothetical protein
MHCEVEKYFCTFSQQTLIVIDLALAKLHFVLLNAFSDLAHVRNEKKNSFSANISLVFNELDRQVEVIKSSQIKLHLFILLGDGTKKFFSSCVIVH